MRTMILCGLAAYPKERAEARRGKHMKCKKILKTLLCAVVALVIPFSGCAASCNGCRDDEMQTPAPGGDPGGEAPDNPDDNPGGAIPEEPDDNPGDDNGGEDNGDEPPPDNGGNPDGEPAPPDNGGDITPPEEDLAPWSYGVYNPSKVGYSAEYISSYSRTPPAISDGGLERYPAYGTVLPDASEGEKEAIIAENLTLIAGTSTYDSMDAEGNLYLNGAPTGQKLYKHTASAGMYEGDVSDDEPAVVKRISYVPRGTYGNLLTGLYAPAGEVVTIEMSAEDARATGGLIVYIGQALTNGAQNNIWAARDFVRMPNICNKMETEGECSYVGSFLGGPVYLAPRKNCRSFSVTISGAVSYPHYIHGYTSRKEYEELQKSTAPYFDLEVWDDAVRHSGPAFRASKFGYDELVEAAELWDKIACVSNRVPAGSGGDTGINFLYDPFIAAGSMVAFVGRHTVNCPIACLTAALDARSATENASDEFWGCIHEFNHHYQRFGFYPGDEVTNNAVSIAEYTLFTRISSNRSENGQGNYAVSWNRYTDPAWSLSRTIATDEANSALDSYTNLIHSFGQDAFIKAAQNGGGSGGANVWYKAVSDATGYDMTYYFTQLLHQQVDEQLTAQYAAANLPVYVPVATVYQTGAGYLSGGERVYVRTAQPYIIRPDKPFTLNLRDSLIVPQGFSFKVKSLTSPASGTLEEQGEGVYVYTPSGVGRSGEMVLTLGISRDDGAFAVEDVQLVIELEASYSNAPLTRTTYVYDSDSMYSSAEDAYNAAYAGYSSVSSGDNVNRIQNGNCEIWEPEHAPYAVMELSGKVIAPSDGKYRLALRGRYHAAMYLSVDGQNYTLAGSLRDAPRTDTYFLDDPSTYTDLSLVKGQPVYFKLVLLVTRSDAYIGLGMGKFNGESVRISHVYNGQHTLCEERQPFKSAYFYSRQYVYDAAQNVSRNQSPVWAQYSPWSDEYALDNLFDGDDTNFIHSDRTRISADNPFGLTVDLGGVYSVNRIRIYGEPSRQYQPKNFVLYGGISPDQLHEIVAVENVERVGNDVIIDFDDMQMRYYKIIVTDTHSGLGYIAFRRIAAEHVNAALEGATLITPDGAEYSGDWRFEPGLYSFGHIYSADNGRVQFKFTGSRLGILSFDGADCQGFDVYIDGEFSGSAEFGGNNVNKLTYVSAQLSEGGHSVELRGKNFNVEGFVLK